MSESYQNSANHSDLFEKFSAELAESAEYGTPFDYARWIKLFASDFDAIKPVAARSQELLSGLFDSSCSLLFNPLQEIASERHAADFAAILGSQRLAAVKTACSIFIRSACRSDPVSLVRFIDSIGEAERNEPIIEDAMSAMPSFVFEPVLKAFSDVVSHEDPIGLLNYPKRMIARRMFEPEREERCSVYSLAKAELPKSVIELSRSFLTPF